ncbi:hypothetical protein BGE01nite_31750 [Brevifollis gellanilyticus]|uniref:Uncharacterized protein n=2 Tax=Brevifollis gellanilyticus TaxID=748831 RepID=A0A512MAX7_9BACT|nr:hypothetical protein BGE01nite_31750 [Brevifollis gellanilyticus]
MWERGVIAWRQKLTDALDTRIRAALTGSTSPRRPSWAAITDPDDRAIQAGIDIEASVDRAEQIATSPMTGSTTLGPGIGSKTADAFIEVATTPRVLMSAANLDEMGAGLGHLAKHPPLAGNDTLMATIIIRSQVGFNHSTLTKFNYTEAEFYRDWNLLMQSSPPVIGKDMWGRSKLDTNVEGVAAGAICEVAAAARLRVSGKNVLAIGPDEVGGTLPKGSAVDILTDTEMFQIGVNGGTVRNKVVGKEKTMAAAIKLALDSPGGAGKRYKFAHFDTDWTPMNSTITDLNTELANLYAPNPSKQIFTLSDFVELPLQ